MEQRRGSPRKVGGFGGKSGARGPRREGGYDRKPREGGREGGYERKPRAEGSSYERKPRGEGRSFGEKSFGEKRPYQKREGGASSYGEKRPYQRRESSRDGGFERAPRGEGRSFGEKSFGEKRPYQKREGGYDRKPREGGYERKPRAEGSSYERKPRDFERSERPFREERVRGDGKNARFDGKREVKRDRFAKGEDRQFQQDGWLVGTHAVLAALKAGRRKVRQVWLLGEARGEMADLLEKNPEWPVEIKAKPDFEKEFGDAVHQGVAVLVGNLPQPSLPEFLATKPKLVVALDQVTDPHNLGAIVRSCAAFGAAGVLVTEHRAAGLSATAAKAAAGAMETVPVVEVVNLVQSIEMMKENGFTVIGLAGEAEESINTIKVDGPLCLVVGSEGDGLRRLTREHSDKLVKIDISSAIESLNVSVATGVALALLQERGAK